MMIIAVLGTLGFSQYRKHSAQARYLKAQDDLKIVAEGLDQYYLEARLFPGFRQFRRHDRQQLVPGEGKPHQGWHVGPGSLRPTLRGQVPQAAPTS